MNRVLVVFSDGLLSELDSARGLVSRSAWIRQAVEDKMMKEAVAPLVPDFDDEIEDRVKAIREAAMGRLLKAEPKPKARRKKSVKDSLTTSGEASTSRKAPRSRQGANTPASVARSKFESPSLLPARCNRGACTGTIKPNGRCIRCNQEPKRDL